MISTNPIARLLLLAAPALFAGCLTAASPEASRGGLLEVVDGGVRTLRVEAAVDIDNDQRFQLGWDDDAMEGSLAVAITPADGEDTTPVRVTLANRGTGRVESYELLSLRGETATTGAMLLFPCSERCSTDVLVTIESGRDALLDVEVRTEHPARVVAEPDALSVAVFDELGEPFGDDE